MQAAVIIFEAAQLYSAQQMLDLKKCVQGLRHTWRTSDLRLLIDRRHVAYLVGRRAQARFARPVKGPKDHSKGSGADSQAKGLKGLDALIQ